MMLFRIIAGAAISLWSTGVFAGGSGSFNCQSNVGAGEVCVPFVGCLGSKGDFFTGRALGRTEGTLAVRSNTGLTCSGRWLPRNFLGVGEANFSCSDGRSGTAYFTYQDPRTGTATGLGKMSDGSKLKVWSGNNIRQFMAAEPGNLNGTMTCGHVAVPIS